ncbi:MAG: hypothetical protein R2854_15040 [Caldilineaceae bacterium]
MQNLLLPHSKRLGQRRPNGKAASARNIDGQTAHLSFVARHVCVVECLDRRTVRLAPIGCAGMQVRHDLRSMPMHLPVEQEIPEETVVAKPRLSASMESEQIAFIS